ncbi:uncharacterized protein GGS22DRAFT_180934 [Annulohypoxylon maeteangense]|uniref:uncharacterized protein n=1 Tax=Annulohypoxylon maeteangense TaxID=1927788 RepID=UPI00200726DA|nr:uncharacterized protein GGS22DRAFT_180934 [Annulohypoxylon maeteangense]KAI0882851.1 hypothetical protein GGS22DRAFT_180934 [Annulohypoxylon maeteangense]
MEPFAIVGLSFKLPQDATDESSFWKVLEEGRNLSTAWPEDRMPTDSSSIDEPKARGAHFIKEDVGLFDAPFFSVTAKEAAGMDPQQRLALETSYHAFENAGIPVETIRGSRTAVFGATMSDDYARMIFQDFDAPPIPNITGLQPSILPNRISWYFDLRGPSVHVDTACSGSMVALDMACQSMQSGNATMALVLGSNLLLTPQSSVALDNANFLSPDGKCFSFDARANGYARGEGIVAFLVRPLGDALRDGDIIRAVIRGIGSNQDGRTPTLTQPSTESQEVLIRQVYDQAGLGFDHTRFFEAHGTGTAIGDPNELTAIGRVFRDHRSSEEPLLVGSVKSSVGHLEGTSGAVGIVKAILALEKGVIPPNALFQEMNSNIDADFYRIQVPTRNILWPTPGLRRASVNSFGFGGTNSHVILDDAFHYLQSRGLSGFHHCTVAPSLGPAQTANGITHPTTAEWSDSDSDELARLESPLRLKLLVWSAADAGTLERMTNDYQDYYQAHIVGSIGRHDQLAYTLAARRSSMPWRTFAVIDGQDDVSRLPIAQPIRTPTEVTSIAFVFTGQGAQYVRMGLELLQYPVFEESLRRSEEILANLGCKWSILTEICNDRNINLPDYSQPLCTALQIALIELLRTFGVEPAAVVGHSSGEIAAAYAIGALSHESACKVAYFRGQLAGKLRASAITPGAMMSVNLPETEVPESLEKSGVSRLGEHAICVACINSPTNVTVSGPSDAIDVFKEYLDKQGVFAQKVKTGIAYHSPAMHAVAAEYLSLMGTLEGEEIKNRGRRIPIISSVTGQFISPKLLARPQYWVDNLVSPVQFSKAMQGLVSVSQMPPLPIGIDTITDLVEVGPHAALRRPVKDSITSSIRYHSVLQRNKSPLQTTLSVLGTLFCHGHPVSILAGNLQAQGNLPFLVDCPPYPFNHTRRYWNEPRINRDLRLRRSLSTYMLGKQAHDWNELQPRWRNWLCVETMPWLGDHLVSDTIICPGTGMMVMAIEAAKQAVINNNRVISGFLLKDAQFLAPVLVGKTQHTSTETMLHLRPNQNAYDKEPTSYDVEIFTYRDEHWTECFRVNVQVQYDEHGTSQVDNGKENQLDLAQMRQLSDQAIVSCTESVDRREFYDYCHEHGNSYGESFRLLREIKWDRGNMSTARIDMKTTAKHVRSNSPLHPAVLDAGIHLVMAQISKGLVEDIPTLVPVRLAKAWISAKAWDHTIPSVRLTSILRPKTKSSTKLASSFWGLADDGSPLWAAEDLIMLGVSQRRNTQDDGTDQTLLYNDLLQLCNNAAQTYDETSDNKKALKSEFTMRMVARIAVEGLKDGELDRTPAYMCRYVASLRHHYIESPHDDGENINASTLSSLLDECEMESPDCRVFIQVGRALPSIIRGETDPLELIHLANRQMRDGRFDTFLDLASYEKPGLRILEVGAGTGSISRLILASLQRLENETGQCRFSNYTYTDISPMFFELQFKTLDLEFDPEKQGFVHGSYDLVIAGLVLHATSNLTTTLGRIRGLLKPGGRIAFQEVINPKNACAHVTFGTLGGWWLSTEDWRKHTPLLTEERADLILRDYQSDISHLCSMIISQKLDTENAGGKPNGTIDHEQGKTWLLIDSDSESQRAVAAKINETYESTQVLHLTDITREGWACPPNQIVVSLLEIGASYLATLSEPNFQTLKKLIQGVENLLWVSSMPFTDDKMADPHSAVAAGFLRSIQTEEPGKHIVLLAIDSVFSSTEVKFVVDVLDTCFAKENASKELEFVVRDGHLSIGRMMKDVELDAERLSRVEPTLRTEPWNSGPSLALEVGTPGLLDTLRFVEDIEYQIDLGPEEVELEAVAWPLSFRDMFVALGRLEMGGLGVECAGVVTRVGQAYPHDLRCGDRAVMIYLGCMRTHPRGVADLVVKIPDSLSFNEAVAGINPGITAYHSLVNVARLQPGEKVLIHSGAGSTGQMAIAIAKLLGAEVFTTVGFDDKKRLLMDQFDIPEDHIFYSRNTSFAKGVMRITNGRGVDVVLNSLSGEGLQASWECIAPYGRFVEIGKADIETNASLPMRSFAKNTSFAAVDLVHLSQTNTKLMRELIEKVLALIAGGEIGSVSNVEKAFRYMQSGTNTGRIIITASDSDIVPKFLRLKSTWEFDPNASYIVAGGFGGIGRAILRWMTDRGARNIIVPSRSGPSSQAALDVVSELTARGVRLITSCCDVGSAESLSALLQECGTSMPPIRGCINSAMVLQDSIFENMTHAEWTVTIQSKVNSSWNLHKLLPQNLDFFILLSSLSGVYGSPGQSNYAGGCTFQDALARSRTGAGHRASVSINLGWMRTIGIIAETERYRHNRMNVGDMAKVEEPDFFALLDHYCDPLLPPLDADHSQVLIGVITQAHFRARGEAPNHMVSRPLFASLESPHIYGTGANASSAAAAQEDFPALFRQARSPREKSEVFVAALKARLARALDVHPGDVDPRKSLSDYGTDSLMAVELRNWIQRDFGVTLAVFNIMGGADIAAVGELVAERAEG